jgi:hypothetical protein
VRLWIQGLALNERRERPEIRAVLADRARRHLQHAVLEEVCLKRRVVVDAGDIAHSDEIEFGERARPQVYTTADLCADSACNLLSTAISVQASCSSITIRKRIPKSWGIVGTVLPVRSLRSIVNDPANPFGQHIGRPKEASTESSTPRARAGLGFAVVVGLRRLARKGRNLGCEPCSHACQARKRPGKRRKDTTKLDYHF